MTTPNAEICLYGCRERGFDYLARHTDGLFVKFTANSQPDPTVLRYESLTEALWRAQRELVDAGASGTVAVYAPGGERVAYPEIGTISYFGALAWETAPVFEISAADIERAAEVA